MPVVPFIPAAVGVASAVMGANASAKAAEGQESAINSGQQQQAALYAQTAQREAPFVQAGQAASQQLQNQSGPGGSLGRQFTLADFQKSPAYNQNIQAALKAIGNSASARGGALVGRPVQDMVNYATNNAGNTFAAAQQGFQQNQQLNTRDLQGQIQAGVAGAGGQNAASGQFGNQVGNNSVNSGNAYAAGQMGQEKAWAGAMPGLSSALQSAFPQQQTPPPASIGSYDYHTPWSMSNTTPSIANFNMAGD